MLANALARAGHDVTILTPRPGPADGPAPLARLEHVPLPATNGTAEQAAQAYAQDLYAAALKRLREERFDALYERYSLWSDVGARLSQVTGLPLVLEVNAPLRQETARYRALEDDGAAARIEKVQFQTAHALAVVSEQLADYARAHGAPAARVHVLPNAVDPERFHPAVRGGSIRGRHNLHGRIVVGFVGRARPWHDLDTLLTAVGRLRAADPRFGLLLVGDMPADLPARLARHGLSDAAVVTGAIPHDQVPAHIAAMDVAVSSHLPLRDFYFSPLKLMEYLACGVPTVAADIGQPGQFIQPGETGWLYPPGEAEALAARIQAIAAQPAEARRVAWQGAVRVLTEHTWDRNAAAVLSWLGAAMPATASDRQALPLIDHKLRQRLYRATRPDLARPLLARSLPAFRRDSPTRLKELCDIQVLKYKPGRRCVLGYRLEGRDRETGERVTQQVIGKVFRDERGRRLHRLQQQLWRAGFGPEAPDRIHVPQSLGYVRKMRMQVQALAPGRTLNDLALERAIGPFIPRAAEGLAKLHGVRLPESARGDMKTYFLGDELRNLETFAGNLREMRPADAPIVDRLYEALCLWADRLPDLPEALPVHRDFYYSQLLFDGERVTLIDFDLFAYGDPAIDVANFTAHLRFMGMDLLGGGGTLRAEEEAFLAAYAGYRAVEADFWERLAFYRAATFFRLLHVVAPRPGLVHLFDDLARTTSDFLETA
jgi:glycosyltransferase involved in cell wall biosynthesis